MKKVLLPAVLLMSPLLSYGRDHLLLSQQDNFSSNEQDSNEEDSSDLDTSDQDSNDQESGDQDTSDQDSNDQKPSEQEQSDQEANKQKSNKHESSMQDSDDQETSDQESDDQELIKQEPSKQKAIKHESNKKDSSKQDLNDDKDSDDEDSDDEDSDDEYSRDDDSDDKYSDDEDADDEDADDEDADDEDVDDENSEDEDADDEDVDDENSEDEDSDEEEEPLSLSGQRNLSLIIAKLNRTIDQNGTLTFGAGSLATFQAWINNLSGKLVFDAANTRIKCAPDSADCSKGLVIFTMPSKNGPICHVKTRSVFGSPRTMYYSGEVKAQFALDNGAVTFLPMDLNKTFPGQYGVEIKFKSVTALGISMKMLTSQYTDSSGLVPQMPPENASATDKRQFDQKLWYSAASHETQYDRNAQQVIDSDKDLCGLAVFDPKPQTNK